MSGFTLGSPLGGSGLVYRGPMFVPGGAAGGAATTPPAIVPGAGTAGSTSVGYGSSIAARGFGITANIGSAGPRTAHWGVLGAAGVSTALLLYMWYSLPR
jgi:hypothetical protein